MMTVLYVETGSGAGGSSASLARLLSVLRVNGVRPVVAVRQEGPNIERIRALGVKVVILPRPFEAALFAKMPPRLLVVPRLVAHMAFLWRLCRQERVKIIHSNTGLATELPALFLAKLLDVPCVCHMRGDETRWMTGLVRLGARCVDEYLWVSAALRRVYGLDRFMPRQAVRIIFDGLEPAAFRVDEAERASQRARLGLGETDCAIGLIARFAQGKGQDLFVQAAQQALQARCDIVCFLVGTNGVGNDPAYEQRIRRQAEALAVGDRVRFIPWQSDVRPVMLAMDIVVLPSSMEGLSLSLVEAMALGRPIIATRVGGIPELVSDGQTGRLIPPGDVLALARALQELAADADRRLRMSAAGRAVARRRFTVARVAGEVLETYERLLAGRATRCAHLRKAYRLASTMASRSIRITARLLGRASRRTRQPFAVVMYHRILHDPEPFVSGVPAEAFERHLRFLKRRYAVLSLSEVCDRLGQGKPLPRRTVCLTFDDGLRNTFVVAFPILSRWQLPATVFLATGAIDRQEPIWTEQLTWWVSRYGGQTLTVAANGIERHFPTASARERALALAALKRWLKCLPDRERLVAMDEIRLATASDAVPDGASMATWDQVRAMAAVGIECGAHTVNHPILSRLNLEDAQREIADSKARIEAVLGRPVRHFAYPNGEAEDFGSHHEALVAQSGFDAACSTIYGLNDQDTDRYALRRIDARDESLARFAARLAGLAG